MIATLIDALITYPLQFIYHTIYTLLYKSSGSVGLAIILFSFILNSLLLPFYIQMETTGKIARELNEKMAKEIERNLKR